MLELKTRALSRVFLCYCNEIIGDLYEASDDCGDDEEEVSSDEISDAENQEVDANIEDTETSNT